VPVAYSGSSGKVHLKLGLWINLMQKTNLTLGKGAVLWHSSDFKCRNCEVGTCKGERWDIAPLNVCTFDQKGKTLSYKEHLK
jgi:hypothetical protein